MYNQHWTQPQGQHMLRCPATTLLPCAVAPPSAPASRYTSLCHGMTHHHLHNTHRTGTGHVPLDLPPTSRHRLAVTTSALPQQDATSTSFSQQTGRLTQQQGGPGVDLTALYTRLLYSPERFIGPVQTAQVSGSGIGLVATEDLRTGDLIMAVAPLALVYGPEGSMPETQAVADQLCGMQPLSPQQLRWLQLLRMERGADRGADRGAGRAGQGGGAGRDRPGSRPTPAGVVMAAQGTGAGQQGQGGEEEEELTLEQQCGELQALLEGSWQPVVKQAQPAEAQAQAAEPAEGSLQPTEAQAVTSVAALAVAATEEAARGAGAAEGAGGAEAEGGVAEGAEAGGGVAEVVQIPGAPVVDSPAAPDPSQLSQAARDGSLFISHVNGAAVATGAAGALAAAAVVAGAAGGVGGGLDPEWVLEAVACNVLGEVREDVALCELRQQEPRQAYCGLWPEFALLNHSCAPNTTHLMVGGTLLVRASRPILAGEELSTCYLGAARWRHVAARRTTLRQQWGFLCGCERCRLEQRLFPTVRYSGGGGGGGGKGGWTGAQQWALDRVFGEGRYLLGVASDPGLLQRTNDLVSQQLEPDLQDALAAPLRSAGRRREGVRDALARAVGDVDKALQDLQLKPREVVLLQASVYRLYQLQAELLQLVPELADGEAQASSLQQCCRIMESAARGSDTHLYLALAASSRVSQQYGKQSPEGRMEQLSASRAHVARYGPVPVPLLQKLMEVRRSGAIASWMGQRLGVLAWDSSPRDKDSA